MKRYLLFDSGCALCTSVAEQVERDANGWLEVRSLNDPQIRQIIERHHPGLGFRPALVTVDSTATGDKVRVFTGPALSMRLAAGLGVRRAARVARHIAGTAGRQPVDGTSRRSLLKAAGTGAVALAGISLAPGMASAGTGKGDGVLSGKALADAVATTRAHPDFSASLAAVAKGGFDAAHPETVAFVTPDGTTVVLTLFNSLTSPETSAALIAHEYGVTGAKMVTEFVTADRNALSKADTLSADLFSVRSVNVTGGASTMGAGAYFSCMVSCIGANCASLALRCRIIPFMAAMLACMVAVCGSKANVCHRICRPLW